MLKAAWSVADGTSMRRPMLVLLTVVLVVTLNYLPTLSAAASTTEPCIVGTTGPQCTVWTGRVTAVHDGDTMDVDVYGDGTSVPARVRIAGIQAMEQAVYSSVPSQRRGDCHAVEATARLEQLVSQGGDVVRLSAQDPRSSSGGRLRRSVAVEINGRWQDVGQVLMREGHTLWLPNSVEYAWNATYQREARRAADAGVNLWDTDYCKSGNNQGTRLALWVNWDAESNDGTNVNGEWIRLRNLNIHTPISLSGWHLRDSDLRRFTFPIGTTIPAGSHVDVFVGSGKNTTNRFYWGLKSPIFDNASRDTRALGDGAYLFDRDGDLRWWMTYPCVGSCTSPLQGKINVTAQPSGTEYVEIRNVSSTSVDLMGHLLVNHPYSFPFNAPTVLRPGWTMRIYAGKGYGRGLTRYWNKPGPILNNDGETVSLRTFDDIEVDCYQWGTGRC
jgi:endonuclease YncB( thermonuclease family)